MIRNRNGYWMDPRFMSPDDGGAGGADPGAAGDPAGSAGVDGQDGAGAGESQKAPENNDLQAQLDAAKAELARQKAALDKATKEAGDARKALKAKMTQEEIDAANKKEEEEKKAARLEELERKVARTEASKSIMGKLGVDEETAGSIAECMAGCDDIDNALLMIQKVWEAKEKKLRMEFGKIPGPGAGGGSEDKEAQAALELARDLGKRKAASSESVRAQLGGLVR